MTHSMVEGTTKPQDFQLKDDGVAVVGTGWTVALDFREDVSGVTVAWLNQAGGTVRVSGLGALARGTYHFRFKLTSGSDHDFVPSGEKAAIELRVRQV